MRSATIITLTYNNVYELDKTVASVFSQFIESLDYVQYIIADDGSAGFDKKRTFELVKRFSNTECCLHDIIIYTNEENIGTVKAFNKAIAMASGDIIIPLSCGDQFYSRSSVQEIVQSFKESGAPMITGFREIVNGKKIVLKEPDNRLVKLFRSGNENSLLKALAIKGNFISGACTYYSKDFLVGVGGFDERFRLLEDYPFYLRVLNTGTHIEFIKKTFMKHAVGGISDPGKPVNLALKKDFEETKVWIKNNVKMTLLERRKFKYFQCLSKKERLSLVYILRYPDCFVDWIFSSLVSRISR